MFEPKFSSIPKINPLNLSAKYISSHFQSPKSQVWTSRKDAFEEIKIDSVVVVEWGTRYTKYGMARDALPESIDTVVAHRIPQKSHENNAKYSNGVCDQNINVSTDHNMNKKINIKELHEYTADYSSQQLAPNTQSHIQSFNKQSTPHTISSLNDSISFEWSQSNDRSFIVGDEALMLNPKEPYKLQWPFKRGRLNVWDYNTKMSLVDDISRILVHILDKLGVENYTKHALYCIMPDSSLHGDFDVICMAAMNHLRMTAVTFNYSSISSTFGIGISSSLVIDIGAQKISISAIEDGQFVENAHIPVGSDHANVLLLELLHENNFPYKDCNLNTIKDWLMVDELKCHICTVNRENCKVDCFEAFCRSEDSDAIVYRFKCFEERLVPFLSLISEDVFGYLDISNRFPNNDPELDFELECDQVYFYENSTKTIDDTEEKSSEALAESEMVTKYKCRWSRCKSNEFEDKATFVKHLFSHYDQKCMWNGCHFESSNQNSFYSHIISEHFYDPATGVETPEVPKDIKSSFNCLEVELRCLLEKLLKNQPTDTENSNEHDPAEIHQQNLKRLEKFTNSILLVGKGSKLAGLASYIENLIHTQYPNIETSFVPIYRDICAWKGGSVGSRLDSAQEYWITKKEYEVCGKRMLRERLPFPITNFSTK